MAQNPTTHAVRQVPVSRRIQGPPPAHTLDDAIKLCDPFSPLDPAIDLALVQNLDAFRGGDRLSRIKRNILRSGGISTLHYLSGHIGSGKTTELLRMKQNLETDPRGADFNLFYLDADLMLDRFDVDLEDILLGLWGVVARESRKAAFQALSEVWSEQIASNVRAGALGLPVVLQEALGKLLGDIKLPSSSWKKDLRSALTPLVPVLIEGLNKAFQAMLQEQAEARSPMDASQSSGVVLLIDNLEKLGQSNRERVNHLFIERMIALRSLEAHLVITVPLYLCQSTEGASLTKGHGAEIVVLPMCKVRERQEKGGREYEPGIEAMASLLKKRIDFARLFQDEDAARHVAQISGGCLRDALRLLSLAINEHDDPPVTYTSIQRAEATVRGDYERALPERYIPILRAIAAQNSFPEECDDTTKQELLRSLFVLEYQNGDPEPWYDIHPLVESSTKYRNWQPRKRD